MVRLMEKTPILVVDDLLQHRRDMAALLRRERYDVLEADSAPTAIAAIRDTEVRLVLHDLDLGGGNSAKHVHLEVGRLIRERGGLFVVITSCSLTANPGKLRAEYFTEQGVPIFSRPPIPWGEILPLFEAARSAQVRQTA